MENASKALIIAGGILISIIIISIFYLMFNKMSTAADTIDRDTYEVEVSNFNKRV